MILQIIEISFTALKSSATKPYYRQQCWEVVRCYLAACIGSADNYNSLIALFKHPSFQDKQIPQTNIGMNRHLVDGHDEIARKTHQTALTSKLINFEMKKYYWHW